MSHKNGMTNRLQAACSPGSRLLNLGSALGPHDLPTVVNDITPIATSAPHSPNGIFERVERSEDIRRVTPDPIYRLGNPSVSIARAQDLDDQPVESADDLPSTCARWDPVGSVTMHRSAAATGAASASHATTSSGSIARQSIYPIARRGCVIGMLTSNGIPAAASFLVGTAPSKILAHRQATLPLCA